MSRKTLAPARRGVAGLTAVVVATAAAGALFVGSSSAAGPVITVDAATVTHPAPTRLTPTIAAAGAYDGKGTAVSIVGTNFPATPTVTFGGVAATSFMRLSDKLIVAKAPALTPATTDTPVGITVGDGTGASDPSVDASLASGYTYKAAPDVTDAKYSADYKTLEITGTNLKDTTGLQLGALLVKVKYGSQTDTKVTVRVPSVLTKARYAITLTTPWGSDTLAPEWSVRPAPARMLAATSTVGVNAGDSKGLDQFIRIIGKSMSGVDSVDFGGAAATFIVSSDTELYVKVPAMPSTATVVTNVAKVDVTVKNGTLAGRVLKFNYKVAPLVSNVSTAAVSVDATSAATNTVVTVTGQNLVGAKFYFGSAKGAKAVSAKTGSTATSAQFVMPKTAATGFALNTAYPLWIVTRGGNLETGRQFTVTG